MDEDKEQRQSILFTVRIWQYDPSQTSLRWRGKVQDVTSGAWRYFHNWDDLVGFLNSQAGIVKTETSFVRHFNNKQESP